MLDPTFVIGSLPVHGRLILAPMDGISTYPFRSLARDLGSAISYSEFISANDVIHPPPNIDNHLLFHEAERPMAYQLLDHDPERLLKAALRLMERSPDIIDLNLGCPARQVTSHGAGAALLKEPEKVSFIVGGLVRALPIPVTAKIRLGWDEKSRNHIEIARRLEDAGATLIAVHGRTRAQGYSGTVDWDAIAEVKSAVHIPVIANGNISSPDEVNQILEHTGCEAVMIGRHAIGNPWIFSMQDRENIPLEQAVLWLHELLNRLVTHYQTPVGVFRFRRYFVEITRPVSISPSLRERILSALEPDEVHILLDQILAR